MKKINKLVKEAKNFLSIYHSGLPEDQIANMLTSGKFVDEFSHLYAVLGITTNSVFGEMEDDELLDCLKSMESEVVDYINIWEGLMPDDDE